MHIQPFQLERYFARYEFNVHHLLCASDCESLTLSELLDLASPHSRQRWETLRLGYTESQGDPALRSAIAATYQTIAADELLVLAPEEAIFLLLHTVLRPGDEVIAITPAYQSLHEICRSVGATVLPWQVTAHDRNWRLDLDVLAQHLSTRTRLIIANFPHNPTGYVPAAAEFHALVALADRHGVPIFCDEMYRGLEYDPAHQLPSICDIYPRGIALSGMSKVYALPGLRIGWLALHDHNMLATLQTLRDYTTICNSAPSEVLALIALEARETIIARNLAIIVENLAAATAFFARHGDYFEWRLPVAGSVAFPAWRGKETVDTFCAQLVEETGVLLAPGTLFAAGSQHFRIGLGRRTFLPGLAAWEAWLTARA